MIRNSIRLAVLTAVALSFTEQAALAQTDVQADPAHHKLLFENEHVRVVRATFGAGEKSTAPFDAKEVVVVRVKGSGPITINIPYGAPITGDSMEPGEVSWAPAGRIQPENKTDQRLEFIVIEPKH
jgi:hypothetical protein